jgi:hypothetical protein
MTLEIPDDWVPTAAAINALPLPLRRYIHMLETHMDPQTTLQQLYECRTQAKALEAMVAMLRD